MLNTFQPLVLGDLSVMSREYKCKIIRRKETPMVQFEEALLYARNGNKKCIIEAIYKYISKWRVDYNSECHSASASRVAYTKLRYAPFATQANEKCHFMQIIQIIYRRMPSNKNHSFLWLICININNIHSNAASLVSRVRLFAARARAANRSAAVWHALLHKNVASIQAHIFPFILFFLYSRFVVATIRFEAVEWKSTE